MSGEAKRLRRVGALVLVLQIGLGLLAAQLFLSSRNTLANNGNWIATKTTLAVPVMGAFSYLFSRQTLAGGWLNLAAWHGRQEVVLDREVDPVSIEVDFYLDRGAQLSVEFNRSENAFHGIRLSKAKGFPPIFFRASTDGRFLRKKRLKSLRPLRQAKEEVWQRLKIDLGEELTTVFLDGEEVGSFEIEINRPQRIGFRGGKENAYVDNLRVVSRDGGVFRDSFGRPRNSLLVNLLAIAGVVSFSWCLFFLSRRFSRAGDQTLLFYFLMLTGVALIVGGVVYGFTSYRKFLYPDPSQRLRAEEAHWKESSAERIFARIESEYLREPQSGIHRVLFLGSSQTWGSGAALAEETLVARTEALLNERAGRRSFECINAAVSGYTLEEMGRDLEERWLDFEPHTVVVNAANNNVGRNLVKFENGLEEMIEKSREAGSRVVLIMEPNGVGRDTFTLRRLHGIMARVGESQGVPVLDMHADLAERYDDGFLWWDWVHLTSFGHQLFAERLVDGLVRHGLVDVAAGASTTMATTP